MENTWEKTIVPLGARTSTFTSGDEQNLYWPGAYFYLNVTANPGGAETLTFALQAKNSIQGKYRTITAFAASQASAGNVMHVFLISRSGIITSPAANFQVQGVDLPPYYRVIVQHSAAGSWTYSVEAGFTKG